MLMALALIPAIIILVVIYCCDKNKEPKGLLTGLFFAGMGTIISAVILEVIGELILDNFVYDDMMKAALMALVVVAPAEELGKYFVMRMITWKSKHFDYLFDGIVYAVFTSLGFATLENIGYVFQNGVITGIVRMFSSVPGHACFAVFMGFFYSKAKHASAKNKKGAAFLNKVLAIVVPILLHGFYDAFLMVSSASYDNTTAVIGVLGWIVMLIAMFVCTIILIVKTSKNDFYILVLEDKTQIVYSARMLGTWLCTCGRTCSRNYCIDCGNKRPTIADWYCASCGSRSYWNFCGHCGAPKPNFAQIHNNEQ